MSTHDEFDVVILRAKLGFPKGVWTTVLYRPMAEGIAQRLLTHDGVRAVVRKRKKPAGSGFLF